MTYGSLFSGVGGIDLGFDAAGLTCRFQVEIDRTARSVLTRHWPDVVKFPDVRTVGKADLRSVDVLVGGFPCQDISVAGNREGLSGQRSGLFHELLRIARELRPGYVVWENVAGLSSSDDGRDFATVVSCLADAGYFGAVRLVDAQYYGVPQQRRRYFGVFARGHSGARRACEVLAVADSLRRHPAESGEKRPGVTGTITARTGRNGGASNSDVDSGIIGVFGGNDGRDAPRVAACLSAKGGTGRLDFESENFVLAFNSKQDGGDAADVSPTLLAMGHRESHANAGGQVAVCVTGARTHALTSEGADASEDGTGRGTPIIYQCHGTNVGPMGTLRAGNGNETGGVPFVFNHQAGGSKAMMGISTERTTALGCTQTPAISICGVLRRLTPRECERLMGWPDDHTRWRADGTEIKDGPRYRMIGNGVVKQQAEWIGRRLMEAA